MSAFLVAMAPLVDFIMIQIAGNEYFCHLFVANNIGMGSDSLMEKVGWCKHFFFSSCAVHFRSSISSVPMRKILDSPFKK